MVDIPEIMEACSQVDENGAPAVDPLYLSYPCLQYDSSRAMISDSLGSNDSGDQRTQSRPALATA